MTKSRTNADNVTADIAGITAGTGITGGGTSGTVTITNDMATTIAAKGDLLAGTANDAYSAITVGANDTVLVADSAQATGLKWATPASGGMTLISTTTLNAVSTTISSISQDFKNLQIMIRNPKIGSNAFDIRIRLNNDANTLYKNVTFNTANGSVGAFDQEQIFINGLTSNSVNSETTDVVNLYDYNNTTTFKIGDVRGFSVNSTNTANFSFTGANFMYGSTTAISSITIFTTGSLAVTGTVLLYGVK